MLKDVELCALPKKHSYITQAWKSFVGRDSFLVTPTYNKYRWLLGLLFGVGILYILLVCNFDLYRLMIKRQKVSTVFHNGIPKTSESLFQENSNATRLMTNTHLDIKDVGIGQRQDTSVTWHHFNDKELQQYALRAANNSNGRKLAFLFMIKDSMPFAPLWERYFRGHEDQYSIYIHAHPDYVPSFNTTSPFFGRFVPSKVVEWGKVSLQEAENRLLFNALLDDNNGWFILLSESCIPVDNFPNTYKYIMESNHSFAMSFQESKVLANTRLNRGRYWEMAPKVDENNFRKGSQWFQINRDLALVVAKDAVYYKMFVNSFCQPHPVCYIDEHYMPTLFFNERREALAYRTLTFFAFHENSAHPDKWDNASTNGELIKNIREIRKCSYNGQIVHRCHFFARKFDRSALPTLLELAQDVMNIP